MEVLVGPALRIDHARSDLASVFEEEEEESSDSSIGEPDDSEEEEEDEEEDGVVSSESGELKKGSGSLGSFSSLEDALQIKRGLSLHISGKSKSFTNLAEAHIGTAKDLEKTEHPFNKRKRMIRWSTNNNLSSGYYKWSNPRSMPVLPSIEDEEVEEDEEEEEEDESDRTEQQRSSQAEQSSPRIRQKLHRHRVLKSRSCFALADLPEEEDDDEDY